MEAEGKKFILKKITHIGGEKWSDKSILETSYYVGKKHVGDKESDNYSTDINNAYLFDSNKHRTRLRAPNPFKRTDLRKIYVDEDFVIDYKKRREIREQGIFQRILNKLTN